MPLDIRRQKRGVCKAEGMPGRVPPEAELTSGPLNPRVLSLSPLTPPSTKL